MIPNIFQIATKELSQDAFVNWLLLWADQSNRQYDKPLHLCAQSFVKNLMAPYISETNYEIRKVVAGRQWENIDIWAEVNDEYLIIIEDKTFTSEHSGQLLKYKTTGEKWCLENNYKLACIYLKIGSEPALSLKKIESEGFNIFSRKDFLRIFGDYPDIKNNIFVDFKANLEMLEKSYNSFGERTIQDWEGNSWVGFYQFLEGQFEKLNWFLVNNPSGGFWGAITKWAEWGNFAVYIQIEQGKLCFKISYSPDDIKALDGEFNPDIVQDQLQTAILERAKGIQLTEIKPPNQYRHKGMYRTVAIVEQKDWLGQDESKVDLIKVVGILQGYNNFLEELVKIPIN